ncbi:MAG: PVC-type heme-binding CxxCH protein [Verrucomicrobiota bacterium]|nr:PVC-type heme-binding CxxCH protein [Verrucomicrobiota bacterium]
MKFLMLFSVYLLGSVLLNAAEQQLVNTQDITTPFVKPADALEGISLPDGFTVQLSAAEPDVRQPIAMAWDSRGRLWVAECYTYAESRVNFDLRFKDRILIFEDSDNDGVFDSRKVFLDQLSQLSSIEIGFGGVWAACAPNLLFIPDRDGDDVADAAPEVVLDGFDNESVRHNIVNGLKWGPDGWLYGRHGILASSEVGVPGTPREQRARINCSIFRYHPVTNRFDVICHGTTNSWGHDWDEHGQLFFINSVIGHLWHALPGARYKRMYGNHFDKFLYELIPQTADHYHWDQGNEHWADLKKKGMTSPTDVAGGGHAHCGMMIYGADNWPQEYRGQVFTMNLHGRRINRDILMRQGAGYVGRHAKDLMRTRDLWFRGTDLGYGPDGGVFVLDWSDIGECHENDGIHRTSGRIFKVSYGKTKPLTRDLAKLSSLDLANLQTHPNEWHARMARRVLQERAVAGEDLGQARKKLFRLYSGSKSVPNRLRAMWSLHITGDLKEEWLLEQSRDESEHIRVWSIKLLTDDGQVSDQALGRFVEMAKADLAGLVQLHLASTLRLLPLAKRWALATPLVSHKYYADDPVLPLMIWYGINPAVGKDRTAAIKLLGKCQIPKLRQFISRRLAGDPSARDK